jgi:prepilin-type N-terminal cleavage/methylation domain-containing protein
MLCVPEVPVSAAQTGFSLIELLLAAWILGVGLLGLAGVQVAALRMLGASRARLEALALAEGSLAALQGDAADPVPGARAVGRFTLTLVWLPVRPGTLPGLRAVAAQVCWREEAKGEPRNLVLTRFVAGGGQP